MVRVAVLDDYQHRAQELADWSALGEDTEVSFFHRPMDGEELVARLAGHEILVSIRKYTVISRDVLQRLPDLRFLVTTGRANSGVDVGYLLEQSIPVAGLASEPSEQSEGVSGPVELAWSLIFALAKRTTIEDRAMRAGRWQIVSPVNLAGQTLGLAGLGRLGGEMVGPARAFGMDVIAWSENLTEERAANLQVRRVSKDELLRESDVLSIHLVLSDRTRGLFGRRELESMKPSSMLINTSRGPIVDEQALIDALATGRIGGAGLDVYDNEPLPANHPLLRLESAVLSPHIGHITDEALRHSYSQVVEDIAAYLKGDPIRLV